MEICSGAESAMCAVEDADFLGVVFFVLEECVVELSCCGGIDCVPAGCSVERYGCDAIYRRHVLHTLCF